MRLTPPPGIDPPTELTRRWSAGGETPVITQDVDFFNKALKKVQPCDTTSYSYRRLFIHTVLDSLTDETGLVDWCAAMQITGHKCEKTLRCSYAEPFKRPL